MLPTIYKPINCFAVQINWLVSISRSTLVVNGLTKTRLQRTQLNTRLNLSDKRVNLAGYFQKQPSRGVLKKRCSENIQQIYARTPMLKCDFNKVAKQLYWNHTSAWVLSCKFVAYFQITFSYKYTSGGLLLYFTIGFLRLTFIFYQRSLAFLLD